MSADTNARPAGPSLPRTIILTAITMIAFAANSILCRLALQDPLIDAGSFTSLRLLSGALTLLLISRGIYRKDLSGNRGGWISAAMLFLYAGAFSFAYLELSTGTGALILFGAVQLTMMIAGLRAGERMRLLEWAGFVAAIAGLIYLVLPGLSAPSPGGSLLMMLSGIGWGIYSLLGRNGGDPVVNTTANFSRAVPFALLISLLTLPYFQISSQGILLAVLSGSITSGCGYVIWYMALAGLTVIRASIVQLSVPVIAAAGGVIFLSETISLRLLIAGTLILGGIFVAISGRRKKPRKKST